MHAFEIFNQGPLYWGLSLFILASLVGCIVIAANSSNDWGLLAERREGLTEIVFGVAVFLSVWKIGWDGPLNSWLTVAIFVAAPLLVLGLWDTVGGAKWSMSDDTFGVITVLWVIHVIITLGFVIIEA